MIRTSTENRRRSSMAPRRVSDSAVKSAVKPSRVSAAAPGSSVKSRLPRPSVAPAARPSTSGAGPRAQRSVAGPPARSRLTVGGPRLSSFTPQAAHRAPSASTASKAVPSRLSMDTQRRLSRGSGIGANRQRCADPRPISDKSYWQSATHRVVQFLSERGYNENRPPVTYKDLIKCTGREFDDIFSFIYSFFHPRFTMAQKKREELVPSLMKTLNYPGLITKSHLITIGCAHSWPSLVAVLDWLADAVNLAYGPAEDESDPVLMLLPRVDNNGFQEMDRRSCVMLEHGLETYNRWLANQERGPDEDARALYNALSALRDTDPEELRRLEAENQRLSQDRPDLSRLRQHVDEASQRLATAETDARRLAEYVASRRDQQTERLKQHDYLQKEAQERTRLTQLKRDQLDALRVELSQQEMSAEDVAKIAQQRTQLKKSIDEVKEEIEQLSADNGALEMSLARASSQHQAAARRLNAAAAPLHAQLVGGEQLQQLRLAGSEGDQLQQVADMERAMETAERAARREIERLQTVLLQQERHSREVRGQLEQARQEDFHVTSRLRRLEEEEAADGRQLHQRHAALDAQIAEMETELTKLNQEIQALDIESQRGQLEADIKRLEEENAERERQLAVSSQQVAESAALALEFRRWMEDDTDQLTRHIVSLCAEADDKLQRTMQRHKQHHDELQDGDTEDDTASAAREHKETRKEPKETDETQEARRETKETREPLTERNRQERGIPEPAAVAKAAVRESTAAADENVVPQ